MAWDPKQHPRSSTGEFAPAPAAAMPASAKPLHPGPATQAPNDGLSPWSMLRDERAEVADRVLAIVEAGAAEPGWIDDEVIEAIVDNAVRARGYDPGYEMDGWETRQVILRDVLARKDSPLAEREPAHDDGPWVLGGEIEGRYAQAMAAPGAKQSLTDAVMADVRQYQESDAEARTQMEEDALAALLSKRLSADGMRQLSSIAAQVKKQNGADFLSPPVAINAVATWVFNASSGLDHSTP